MVRMTCRAAASNIPTRPMLTNAVLTRPPGRGPTYVGTGISLTMCLIMKCATSRHEIIGETTSLWAGMGWLGPNLKGWAVKRYFRVHPFSYTTIHSRRGVALATNADFNLATGHRYNA